VVANHGNGENQARLIFEEGLQHIAVSPFKTVDQLAVERIAADLVQLE
jgi:hypothetical protein